MPFIPGAGAPGSTPGTSAAAASRRAGATLPPTATGEASTPPGATREARPRRSTLPPPVQASGPARARAQSEAATAAAAATSPQRAGAAPTQPDSEPPLRSACRQLARECETELARRPEQRRAARLTRHLAALYEGPLSDPARAQRYYEQLMELAPEDPVGVRRLRRLSLRAGQYDRALPLFATEAHIAADPQRKALLHYERGRLCLDQASRLAQAATAFDAAAELDGSNPAILRAVERVAWQSRRWDALSRAYERLANSATGDPHYRAALIVRRARVVELHENQRDRAAELLEHALAIDPDATGATLALARIYQENKRWRELTAVLARSAERTGDVADSALTFYRVGRLMTDRLGSQDEAILALQRASAIAPGEPLILEELLRLHQSAGQHAELAENLAALADAQARPGPRAALLHSLGELAEGPLADEDRAIRCHRAALDLDPTFLPALQSLGALYRRRRDWQSLVAMYEAEAAATRDSQRAAAAHAQIAALREQQLGRPDEAMKHHARALELHPAYQPSFDALTRLYRQTGNHRALVELHERALDRATDPAERAGHLLTLGSLWEEFLADPVQAAHAYRRALELPPDPLVAVHALQRSAERAGRHTELIEAIDLELAQTRDPRKRVALLHRAGCALLDLVGDAEAALSRFTEALELDARFGPALASMGRIHQQNGRWDRLLEVYRRQLALASDRSEAAGLLHKMGELCERRLGRSDEAIELYRRAADSDPAHRPATRALARCLRERADWQGVAQILSVEAAAEPDPASCALIWYRTGEILEERLEQNDRAIAAYEKALELLPGYPPAAVALTRLHSSARAWKLVVADLQRELSLSADPQRSASLLYRQGEVLAEHLGDREAAVACFRAAADVPAGELAALLALERLHEEAENWNELATTYRRQAELFRDAGARTAVLRQLTALRERFARGDAGDRGIAEMIADYRALLASCPDDDGILERLAELAEDGGDHTLLRDCLATLGEVCEGGLASHYLTRLALLQEDAGDDAALATYRRAVACDPDNLVAVRGMARCARAAGDDRAGAEAAVRAAALAGSDAEAADLYVQSAVLRYRFDQAAAQDDLERALERCPDHPDAAEGIIELLLPAGEVARLIDLLSRAASRARDAERIASLWREVALLYAEHQQNRGAAQAALQRGLRARPDHLPCLTTLAEAYAAGAQWQEAADTFHRVIELSSDRQERAAARLRLAAICIEALDEPSRALVQIQAVLDDDPRHAAALGQLVELHSRAGRIAEAIEAARHQVAASDSDPARVGALLRLADLEKERGNLPAAWNTLCEAVALDGPDGVAASSAESLGQHGDWDRYARALATHLQRIAGPAQRVSTYLALARVFAGGMKLRARAIETLREALPATEHDPRIATELADQLCAGGRAAEAVSTLHALLASDVASPVHWRNLALALSRAGREREALLALAPLTALNAATAQESSALASRAFNPAGARPGTFTGERIAAISVDHAPTSRATALLAALGDTLPRLYPPDLESFGISRRDRLDPRSGRPIRALAARLAEIFGVEFELYEHMLPRPLLAIELGAPPLVVVAERLSDLPPAEQTFYLARGLAAIACNIHPALKFAARELELLLAAAVCSAGGTAPALPAGSADLLDEQIQNLRRALPRKSRRAVELAAADYATAGIDPVRWHQALLQTANRAALLMADDLNAALAVLRREENLMSVDAPTVLSHPPVADLARFWVSDQAAILRRQTGIWP